MAIVMETTDSSRTRLLRAAERRILDHGVQTLSIRLIAAESGANSALIKYYFGNMDGLLAALAAANLDPMIEERARLMAEMAAGRAASTLDRLLEAYLHPMWHEAAHCPGERGLVVVSELITVGPPALRDAMALRIDESFRPVAAALADCLPHLDRTTLIWRFSSLNGIMLAMIPRPYARDLYRPLRAEPALGDPEAWFRQFTALAKGALLAPPP